MKRCIPWIVQKAKLVICVLVATREVLLVKTKPDCESTEDVELDIATSLSQTEY